MRRNNQQQKKTKVGNRKAGSRTLVRVERMEHPSQLRSFEINHRTRLRFTVTAACLNTVITPSDILDSILIAATAIAGFELFDIFKITSIEIWGIVAQGAPSTVQLIYSTATGDRATHTDTSLGVKPAYIKAIPSRSSLASFWTSAGGGSLMLITAPAGSILDINVEFRTSNLAPVACQNALVGATIGEVYWRGLDGLAVAGTNFPPPVGIQTI